MGKPDYVLPNHGKPMHIKTPEEKMEDNVTLKLAAHRDIKDYTREDAIKYWGFRYSNLIRDLREGYQYKRTKLSAQESAEMKVLADEIIKQFTEYTKILRRMLTDAEIATESGQGKSDIGSDGNERESQAQDNLFTE